MTRPEPPPPTFWPPGRTSEENSERLDRVIDDLVKDQWADEFIKRFNYTIGDILRKK
jgi:hypothetical protein